MCEEQIMFQKTEGTLTVPEPTRYGKNVKNIRNHKNYLAKIVERKDNIYCNVAHSIARCSHFVVEIACKQGEQQTNHPNFQLAHIVVVYTAQTANKALVRTFGTRRNFSIIARSEGLVVA